MGWWTNERKRYAAQYLINNASLSPMGAAGLVSRWANVEASGGPTSVNPSSGAFGIAQWLGSRLPPIKGNVNFDAQLAYAARELNGSEARAGNALRSATSFAEAARGASMYERAEGYNSATGKDNWTARTQAGIPAIYALMAPAAAPPVVAQEEGPEGAVYQDSLAPGAGMDTKTVIAAAAGIGLLWYFFFRN